MPIIGNGWSTEEIIRQYPHMTAAEMHATLGYYYDHLDEVNSELSAEIAMLDAADSQAPSALRLRLLAILYGIESQVDQLAFR